MKNMLNYKSTKLNTNRTKHYYCGIKVACQTLVKYMLEIKDDIVISTLIDEDRYY